MVFSSILFIFIYLPVVLAVYYLLPRKWRNLWLFVVNLVFYGWGEPVYILLMVFSVSLNYFSGRMIDKYRADDKKARLILVANTAINILLLVFFKYYDLLAETISLIPGLNVRPLGLGLPIGISFYTFQNMSYVIDVYRGDTDAQKNYIDYGTYLALFPQLIAGPIVRYKDVAEQLETRTHSVERFASGVRRFVIGLAKKTLIANNIGRLWDVYAGTPVSQLTFVGSWLGIIAFSLQIYFDFSGYSDMAIGLGRMLGFEFLENFNYPYISKSITEFWRRWHMSLSGWFRDYVYIPLGGSRKGLKRQIFNLLVVWALTGIWHGANWTFLLWGLYYAFFLIIEKVFLLRWLEKIPSFVGHIYALLVAVCGWVLFELGNMSHVVSYYKAMFGLGGGGFISGTDRYYLSSFLLLLIVGAVASTPIGARLYEKMPDKVKGVLSPLLAALVMVISTAYLVDATYNPFLYFRF